MKKVICIFGMLIFLMTGQVNAFEIKNGFVDYGGGLINIEHVFHIISRIDYVVTYPQDNYGEFFNDYVTRDMSDESIQGVINWFRPEINEFDYYFVSVNGNIKFDDFTLIMVEEKSFYKLPSDPIEIERVSNHNKAKFRKFLLELDSVSGECHNNNRVITLPYHEDSQYQCFIRSMSPITNADFQDIKRQIENQGSSYRSIVHRSILQNF